MRLTIQSMRLTIESEERGEFDLVVPVEGGHRFEAYLQGLVGRRVTVQVAIRPSDFDADALGVLVSGHLKGFSTSSHADRPTTSEVLQSLASHIGHRVTIATSEDRPRGSMFCTDCSLQLRDGDVYRAGPPERQVVTGTLRHGENGTELVPD